MKKLLATFFFTIVLLAPASAQVQPDAAQRAAKDAFTARHGNTWFIRWNETTGTPASIFWGKTQPFEGTPLEAARAFLLENRKLFKMKPGLSDLEHVRTQERRGIYHVKFQQTYRGLPVDGAEYLVHIHEDGGIDMANGVYYPTVATPTRPVVTETAALGIAQTDLGNEVDLAEEGASELVVYPDDARFHLAWKLHLTAENPLGAWVYYVDAINGKVLHKRSDVREIAPLRSGARLTLKRSPLASKAPETPHQQMTEGEGAVYVTHPGLISVTDTLALPRLVGNGTLNGTHVEVENLVSSNAYNVDNEFLYLDTNTHFDEVNVYYHVDRFRENYIKTLGNISLGKVTAQVHFAEANAKFIAPTTLKIGDSIDLFGNPISGAEDFAHEDKIMYHEYMHAVSYDISDIEGDEETGAIDEGLSDYFAGSFTVRTKILDYANPSIERDMTDPDVDHYDDYDTNTPRHKGGEFFSAILWDLRIDIGQTDTDDMIFGALYRITSSPDFEDYREAILADAFLYGNSEACAVAEAFSDRGIGDPLLTNITGPSGLGNYEEGTWTAQTPCTSGSHSYQWRYRFNGVGSWSSVVGTSVTYSRTMITTDFELKVTVTKSGQTAENTHYVDYCSSCSGGGPRLATPHAPEEALNQATLAEKPTTFALESNYPNPFNPSTEIRFQLAENVKVTLVVYDLTGREIARLVDGALPTGYHRVTWEAGNMPSGVYVYRLTAGDFTDTQHMVLMK